MSAKRNKDLAKLLAAATFAIAPLLISPAAAFADPSSTVRATRYAQNIASRSREVSDHDHARESTRTGQNRSFQELLRNATARGRGEYLGVEPDISRNIYRFKFMRPGGNMVWVDVDGKTARVIAERN